MSCIDISVPIGIYIPDKSSVIDLSDVADKPTKVIVTSSRLIVVENLKILVT